MTYLAKTPGGLLPCPFCGGEAKEFTGEDAAPHRWTVECDSCGAHVGSDTRHKARAKWNRRAERTCRIVPMDAAGDPPYRTGNWILNSLSDGCSECGYPFDTLNSGTPNFCPNCGARVIKEDL